ncbi:MAG TPA: hypothetical protein VGK53_15865 [Propionicimonas sp.]
MSVAARLTAILLGLVVVAAGAGATPASADGGADCKPGADWCDLWDGGEQGGGGGGKGGGSGAPQTPLCSAFPHGVPDNPPKSDWVYIECRLSATDVDTIGLWVPPRASAEQIAWMLIARLKLKPIEIGLTPLDPNVMTAVGIPVWLWVDNPSRTSWGPATITAGGLSLTARVESVTWTLGDGTVLRCGKGTEWRPSMVDRHGMISESPTCGHIYQEQGRYAVRAAAHWVARWHGYGEAGTIRLDVNATRQLRVGEIQVIVTRGR